MQFIQMNRKPLFHIFLFGFLLALTLLIAFGLPTSGDEARRIIIDDSDVAQLRAAWMRQWQREPTAQELRGLLEQHIREEVLYREALARGFDKDDMVVRRTMMRKMEFLGQSQAEALEPSDEEIQAYFALRQERYRQPGRVSFVHIYFNRDQRGEGAEQDAGQTLEELRRRNTKLDELSEFGDRFMLAPHYVGQTERQISSQFGENFARQVFALEPQVWQGPVESGYGLHLVYVYEREEAITPDWREIKPNILQDMRTDAEKAAKELFYSEILRNYRITYRGQTLDILGEKEN